MWLANGFQELCNFTQLKTPTKIPKETFHCQTKEFTPMPLVPPAHPQNTPRLSVILLTFLNIPYDNNTREITEVILWHTHHMNTPQTDPPPQVPPPWKAGGAFTLK